MSLSTTAAARQKEMNASMAVVAIRTRGRLPAFTTDVDFSGNSSFMVSGDTRGGDWFDSHDLSLTRGANPDRVRGRRRRWLQSPGRYCTRQSRDERNAPGAQTRHPSRASCRLPNSKIRGPRSRVKDFVDPTQGGESGSRPTDR